MKPYHVVSEEGTPWEKLVKCFGFKLHLIVDFTCELPVAHRVTKASAANVEGHKLINKLMDPAYGMKPVMDIRKLWKDERERPLPGSQNMTSG